MSNSVDEGSTAEAEHNEQADDVEGVDLDEFRDELDAEIEKAVAQADLDADNDGSDAHDVEVVDDDGGAVKRMQADNDGIATYSTSFGSFRFKILPQSTQSGLRWAVWVFVEGAQGPVLQTYEGITSEQAKGINLPERLRSRINDDLTYARENMTLPDGFESETSKKSLNDLEARMGK